ncbi:MAG: ABC transporter permease, partial [Candidatus Dormibacteraeota bacterium]|nr:ABC transporter permease [Candidatus Dormibacteraeota bacterium]
MKGLVQAPAALRIPLLWRRLAGISLSNPRLQPRLAAGLALVGTFGLVALLAPWIAPYHPLSYSAQPLAVPSPAHWLGANDVGQDTLSQWLYGARVSLLVGLAAATLSTGIAWALGLVSGLSRPADSLVSGVADLMLAMPQLPLVILVAAYLGASLPVVIITLGVVTWGPFARIIRGQVQSELRKPYIEAARGVGTTPVRTLIRHVAPATVPTALAKFVMTMQYAVVAQASLAFLGLGEPTTISWGDMVHRAAISPLIFLDNSWLWRLAPPALAIGLMVVGFA